MTGFTDIFDTSPVSPSDVGYNRIDVTVSPFQLEWPDIARDEDAIAARIMEISGSSGAVLRLPDATLVSTGQDVLFRNVGGATIGVETFTGGSLLTLGSGEVKYIYLTDASTPGGTWTVVAFGASTGTLDASQLAGFGLTVIGATLNTAHPTSTTAASITILGSDRARLYEFTGGAATVTLNTAASYGNNFFFMVGNLGSGAVTIDPAGTDLVDGAVSIDINPGESAMIITDGINWYTVGRGRSVLFNFTQLVKDVSGNTNVVLTTTEASNKILKFIGTLTGDIAVIVPNIVSLYVIDNSTTGAFSLTVKTAAGTGVVIPQGQRNIVYSDGTNVLQAITVAIPTTAFGDGTVSNPSITFAADTDTGIFRPATNTIGFSSGGILQMTIDPLGVHFVNSQNLESLAYAVIMG
jgi:hypothetical protein